MGLSGVKARRARNVILCQNEGRKFWVVEDEVASDSGILRFRNPEGGQIKLQSQKGIHKPAQLDFAVTVIIGGASYADGFAACGLGG